MIKEDQELFTIIKKLKKRIESSLTMLDNYNSKERTKILINITNLENTISDMASEIDWSKYDFSDCLMLDIDGKIQNGDPLSLEFVGVSYIWLVFKMTDLKGVTKIVSLNLNRNDFNIDFLDKIRLKNNNQDRELN